MGINCLLGVLGTETQELADLAKTPGIIQKYFDANGPRLISFLIKLVLAVLVLIIGIKVIKGIVKLINKSLKKSSIDAGVISFLTALIKYVLYFILIMTILSCFGVTTGSVVAILGSAGLTVGLALQGSLSNFAGGVLILVIKPFVVGDYIIVKDKNVEGTVTDISLFYTRMTTVDNRLIMVPNGGLSDASIVNVSHMDKRRVDIKVGVAYDSDIAKTKEVLKTVAEKLPMLLKEEPIDIFVDELADSAIVFGVRVWVKNEDYFKSKWALNENIKNSLDENGISIPFNQMDVHIC